MTVVFTRSALRLLALTYPIEECRMRKSTNFFVGIIFMGINPSERNYLAGQRHALFTSGQGNPLGATSGERPSLQFSNPAVKDNGNHPVSNIPNRGLIPVGDPRPAVERNPYEVEWEKAGIETPPYKAGKVILGNGHEYSWRGGQTLLIQGKEIMATCEYPWSAAAVNLAFRQIRHSDPHEPVSVLELGFGLNLAANRVVDKFSGGDRRGKYVGVELNQQVYERAKAWKERKKNGFKEKEKEIPGSAPKVDLELIQGEAGKVMEEQLIPKGEKFNIIISDTYPIDPKDEGVNDLRYLRSVVQLLAPGGVFIWYPYSPDAEEIVQEGDNFTKTQRRLLDPYFEMTAGRKIPLFDRTDNGGLIGPQPNYTYFMRNPIDDDERELWGPIAKVRTDGQIKVPILEIPVGICQEPRLEKLRI